MLRLRDRLSVVPAPKTTARKEALVMVYIGVDLHRKTTQGRSWDQLMRGPCCLQSICSMRSWNESPPSAIVSNLASTVPSGIRPGLGMEPSPSAA
jgi:hypothetical protein